MTKRVDRLDTAFTDLVGSMNELDSKERIELLEAVGRLHGMSLTLFALLETVDHKDHDCKLKYPKTIVEGYLDAFGKDVASSMEMTSIANGLEYAPDPNKKVRDEILKEAD